MDLTKYQDSLGRMSSRKLKANNITSEELYLQYHNIVKPKCKNCNKNVKYMGFVRGYNETCSYKCSTKLRQINSNRVHDTKSFIKEAKEKHGDLYDYSKVIYRGSHEPVTIICKEHGEFEQLAYGHISGYNCEKCSYKERHKSTGWSRDRYKNKRTILYYIKLKKENLFKIGITSRSVKERFGKEFKNIEVISEEVFLDGREAFDKEFKILKENKEHRYKGEKVLAKGNSELFSINIIK